MDMVSLTSGAALTIFPRWKPTEWSGINPLWSLVAVTGIGLIVLLWILAFRDQRGRA
jgi:hypothetical protein